MQHSRLHHSLAFVGHVRETHSAHVRSKHTDHGESPQLDRPTGRNARSWSWLRNNATRIYQDQNLSIPHGAARRGEQTASGQDARHFAPQTFHGKPELPVAVLHPVQDQYPPQNDFSWWTV